MPNDICDITCIHEDKVTHVTETLKSIDTNSLSALFKLLADHNRLKILQALSIEKELCVCDLATIIGASNATTSHHLQTLKKIKAIDSRKEGKLAYYFTTNPHIINLIQTGLSLKAEVSL